MAQERGTDLNEDDLDRVQRYEAAFNQLDRALRRKVPNGSEWPFMRRAREAPGRPFTEHDLQEIALLNELRNVVVHEKLAPNAYVSIPTEATVRRMERLRDRVVRPVLVFPTFAKKVTTVTPQQSLAEVLRLLAALDFSQLPVVSDRAVTGLLTENGITRWLSHHVTEELSLVELADVPVADLVREEETLRSHAFVRRAAYLTDVLAAFAENPLLEAVLITETGNPRGGLLGIATRWDILQHMSS